MTQREKSTRQEIATIQKMLGELSEVYEQLPPLKLDGVFGEHTLEALMIFQREFSPPVTGRMNDRTWRTMERMYLQLTQEQAKTIFQWGLPGDLEQVHPGESSPCINQVKFMFWQLSEYLEGIVCGEIGTCHDDATVSNVIWLQTGANMEPNGVICPQVWNMLTRLYSASVIHRGNLRWEVTDK